MLYVRRLLSFVASTCAMLLTPGLHAATVGDGLQIAPDSLAWPQWQARLSVVSQPLLTTGAPEAGVRLGAISLMGDRYFDVGRIGDGGGLRASGALLFGAPSQALAAPSGYGHAGLLTRPSISSMGGAEPAELGATPYFGMGYSAWWAKAGLGLSADLGLLAQKTRGLRLGRSPDGADEGWRSMQLAPVLQVNLSYAF
jgi:hypothetical protein